MLTQVQAREIFALRNHEGFRNLHNASVLLAAEYLVSAKTIRDIWKGRSWLGATYDLWKEEERPSRKALGRPKGKKDSQPRRRRDTLYSLYAKDTKFESPYNQISERSQETTPEPQIIDNKPFPLLPSFDSLLKTCIVPPIQQLLKLETSNLLLQNEQMYCNGHAFLSRPAIQDDSIFFVLARNLNDMAQN